MPSTALVIAGGDQPLPPVIAALGRIDYCVVADSGADHARALGVPFDVLVGDLDSISKETLSYCEQLRQDGNLVIDRHRPNKDQTDLELALETAEQWQPERLVVIGIGGGRVDHALANTLAISRPTISIGEIEGLVGTARLSVVRGSLTLRGVPGEPLTLLPVHGVAGAVSVAGVAYPLSDATIEPGSSWGVSNVFVDEAVEVSVGVGTILAIQPYALAQDEGGRNAE